MDETDKPPSPNLRQCAFIINMDMHLKRASGREKNTIWKESKTSNERECQQRFRAVSLCLSPSQDRLKNLDRREGGVERET